MTLRCQSTRSSVDRRGSPPGRPATSPTSASVSPARVGDRPPPRGARSSPELLRGHGAHQYLARASNGKPTDGAQRIDRSSPPRIAMTIVASPLRGECDFRERIEERRPLDLLLHSVKVSSNWSRATTNRPAPCAFRALFNDSSGCGPGLMMMVGHPALPGTAPPSRA